MTWMHLDVSLSINHPPPAPQDPHTVGGCARIRENQFFDDAVVNVGTTKGVTSFHVWRCLVRNVLRYACSAVAISGLCIGAASAQYVFQDDFEDNAVGTTLNGPQIGQAWIEGAGSGANGITIKGAPALGTRSMHVQRRSAPPLGPSNGQVDGISLPGTVVDGQQVEVIWNHYWTGVHPSDSFNGPMQIAIGQVGSNFNNDFSFILIADGNTGGPGDGVTTFPFHNYTYYSGPGQYQTANQSLTVASLNAPGSTDGVWDTLRAVLYFDQVSATQMGGTMDLYVSKGGGSEITLATGATLFTTDMTLSSDPTSLQFRIAKGGDSGDDFYDDISVRVVPEPSMAALGALGVGLLASRRRRA